MSCSQAHFPDNALSAALPSVQNAKEICKLAKQAAGFLGFDEWQIENICGSAFFVHERVRVRKNDKCPQYRTLHAQGRREVDVGVYSKSARCPLMSAVIAAGAAFPVDGEIPENSVYTVGMAARVLDMTCAAVRRLVRSGELGGRRDRGGYLIPGSALVEFLGKGFAVLGAGRTGAIRL